jgi:uncharacterized protein (DUF1330 family)
MSYYFIAQIRIHDEAEYRKYLDGTDRVFNKYRGRYLAVDRDPEVLEGNWDYSRSVLISFGSKEDFNAWYYSPEYQELLKYRLKGADCDTILLKGSINENP